MSNETHPPEPDPTSEEERTRRLMRWRLIMGSEIPFEVNLGSSEQAMDACLSFLYDREYGSGRNVRKHGGGERTAGLESSNLTVPDWINHIHELFPEEAIERLEKDALERYQLAEMVTNLEVLERATPNENLLKAVLRTKHLMNQEVLAAARRLVAKVIEELMQKLARIVRSEFSGSPHRRRSHLKISKNFDLRETLRRNLKHYNPETRQITIQDLYFFSRVRRQNDQWQIITVVDQSGSMLDSVIHASVTAAIFHGLPSVKPQLCAFSTDIVDLSAECADPVETLMKVQLGGGTDIGNALRYASGLVEVPSRTILFLITDFYEGGPTDRLYRVARNLVESGVTCLGLAALDAEAKPAYNREVGERLVRIGWEIGAMTPGELVAWVAEKVRS